MATETGKLSVMQITEQGCEKVDDLVAREFPLTIILDGQELVTLLCTPTDLEYLAAGFLLSEGLIATKGDLKDISVDGQKGEAHITTQGNLGADRDFLFQRLITSGCGGGSALYKSHVKAAEAKVESGMTISSREIFALVKDFQGRSPVYQATHGVHSAALCDTREIIMFSEDIGRHNAVDKIFGECLLNDMTTAEKILVSSGRLSSEILHKVINRNIPLIVSVAAPTDVAVRLADEAGITLIGRVRGKKMKLYTHEWRVD